MMEKKQSAKYQSLRVHGKKFNLFIPFILFLFKFQHIFNIIYGIQTEAIERFISIKYQVSLIIAWMVFAGGCYRNIYEFYLIYCGVVC